MTCPPLCRSFFATASPQMQCCYMEKMPQSWQPARRRTGHPQAAIRAILFACLLLLLCQQPGAAYSLLTHEQLIDLTWRDSIVPLLLSRYPTLTPAQLEQARAYAYGGCVIQDIGYYPLGDKSFSNLTHYVRSGDFVVNLFRNAGNADELAFAIGALSHYVGDSTGHSLATNLAVPIEFPKLRAKYGPVVSYAQGEHQHVQAEFAFDVNQIVQHHLAPVAYMRHIGLKVPLQQLGLAFYQTYGLREDFSQKRGRRINVRAYRFAVHTFIPRIGYALAILHRHREPAEPDTVDAAEIEKEVAEIEKENNWDAYRHHAGIGTYMLAGLIFILPKFGPLSLAAIKGPDTKTETDYLHSVALSTNTLRDMLARFTPPPTAAEGAAAQDPQPASQLLPAKPGAHHDLPSDPRDPRHPLPNRDLDTGKVIQPGGYSLTDSTYADLLHHLTRQPDDPIPPGVQLDIEAYYANPDSPITTKKDPARWAEVQADLKTLASMPTSTELAPYPTYDPPEPGNP